MELTNLSNISYKCEARRIVLSKNFRTYICWETDLVHLYSNGENCKQNLYRTDLPSRRYVVDIQILDILPLYLLYY